MQPKKKRLEVVQLKDVLRRVKKSGEPSPNRAGLREREKTEPYVVAVEEHRKGGRA